MAANMKVFGKRADLILEEELKRGQFFTVAFDCSNHKHTKLLPIYVSFYDPKQGMQQRLLDLVSIEGEKAKTIARNIKRAVERIPPYKIIGMMADNCPTNFGGVINTHMKSFHQISFD